MLTITKHCVTEHADFVNYSADEDHSDVFIMLDISLCVYGPPIISMPFRHCGQSTYLIIDFEPSTIPFNRIAIDISITSNSNFDTCYTKDN